MTRVRTAIIPVAGLGARMLPATQAIAKELLPVGGSPALDWVLEEAIAAGIDEFVIVTSDRKPAIERYLTDIFEHRAVAPSNASGNRRPRVTFRFIVQPSPRGLGDAVRRGWRSVGVQPVAVVLPDELILGGGSLLASLLEHHEHESRSVVALMQVGRADIGAYGCARLSGAGPHGTTALSGFIEKPNRDEAPSNYAIAGRYVLGTEVLHCLENARPDRRGEIQLTEALDTVARTSEMLGLKILPGDHRIDVGHWAGWLQANAEAFEWGADPKTVASRLLRPARELAAAYRASLERVSPS